MHQIRIRGELDEQWSAWFEGFTLALHGDGTTTLTGLVVDQAALQGLMRRISDLVITLISLNIVDCEP